VQKPVDAVIPVAQESGMHVQADTVEERLHRVDFAVKGIRVCPKYRGA
jgi:hypothetical protein